MNERFSINVNQLKDKHRQKCNNRTKIYESLLEKCYLRVNNAAEHDKNFCIYQVPDFIWGMPAYNLAYCAAYIIYDLKRKGFETKFVNPNVIIIFWEYEEPIYINDGKKSITFSNPNSKMINVSNTAKNLEYKFPTNYRSITDYKPSGNFIN